MREEEGGVRREVRRDLVLVDLRLHLIREQDGNELCARDGFADRGDVEPGGLRLLPEALPSRSPTTTCTPESFRLSA